MVSIECTVQLNIFNTSIKALQEAIDVFGLLRKNSFEFVVLEIPSLVSQECAVDSNSIFSHQLKTNQLHSNTEQSTSHDALDVFTSRTVPAQCSEMFEYGSKASTSEGIVPCSVISCHSEKGSSNDSYRKSSFLDGLFPNFSPNISNISFDADINNHSVLKSFLLENADMSASMQAFLNSMDAFFERQTVADLGLIPAISDDLFFTAHDSIVSIVNRMVDKVCDAETDDANRVDSVCGLSYLATEQHCPLVQSDDLGDKSCTPLEMLEMPKDSALEYCFSDEDNDNASLMTASGMEILDQDLQSRDVSPSYFSSMIDAGSFLDAKSSGDDHQVTNIRSGLTKNRKSNKGKGCRWFSPIAARARRTILCQFCNCSNSFRVGTSKFKLLRHANTHNSNAFSCLHCGFSAHTSQMIHAHHRESPCGLPACKRYRQRYPECVLKKNLDPEAVAQLFKCCFPNYNI